MGVVEEGVMEWDCFGGGEEEDEKRWFRCWSIVCSSSRVGVLSGRVWRIWEGFTGKRIPLTHN